MPSPQSSTGGLASAGGSGDHLEAYRLEEVAVLHRLEGAQLVALGQLDERHRVDLIKLGDAIREQGGGLRLALGFLIQRLDHRGVVLIAQAVMRVDDAQRFEHSRALLPAQCLKGQCPGAVRRHEQGGAA